MQAYQLPKNKAVYNYRYFLPYAPEWGSSDICSQRLKELVDFCKKAEIDAVQFFVNILPGTYYMPAYSAGEQEHYARWMKETVRPALLETGVSFQLNFQMLLGAHSHGLDMRKNYQWDFLVNQHGKETLGCACPLSSKFRRDMGEMLKLWAWTEPDIIWIDDDFRMHNHGLAEGELDFYCYCKTHLARFAEFSGKKYSREKLVKEILREGVPGAVRLKWLDFLGVTMTETARWINTCVHDVSPLTRLALMTSAPDVHSAEGRNWKDMLTALCGPYLPITRPMCGLYTGTTVPVKQNACTYKYMSHSISVLRRIFGNDGIEFGPELENTRFTTWCKSVSNSQYVMIIGQLLGCPQITLSLNDLDGSPISHEPTTVPLLKNTKPFLHALTALDLAAWKSEGIVFIDDEKSAAKVQLSRNAKMADLGLVRYWEDILLECGIPAYHASSSEAALSDDVVALEGYTAWLPSDEDMRAILSKGVLLDAEACAVLEKRGFGEFTGVAAGEKAKWGCQSEIYTRSSISGNEQRIPHRGFRWRHMKNCGAEITSYIIDSQNNRYPGSFVYTNKLGGRVGIFNHEGEFSHGFFGYHARIDFFHKLIRFLSNEKFPVLAEVPHHCLHIVRTRGNEQLIGLANLGTDMINEVNFTLSAGNDINKINTVLQLNSKGEWVAADAVIQNRILTVRCGINVFEWLIIKYPLFQ